jgi:hypothetical protein
LEKANIEALLIAEVGAGGGLAFTGSSESLQNSCEWTELSLTGAKEYFNRLWCLAHEVAPRYVTLPIPNCT